MKRTLIASCVCIVLGLATGIVSRLLKSTYLSTFLEANLIVLLIALLAINTTTMGVVMTKLRELSNSAASFRRTADAMRWSMGEQVALIVLAILFLLAKKSGVILEHVPYADFASEVLLLSIFFYSIQILYDTACSVFDIMNFEGKES